MTPADRAAILRHNELVQCSGIIIDYVLGNKQHHDGTPMLANNVSQSNADRILGR